MQKFMSLAGAGPGAVVRDILEAPDGWEPGVDIWTPDFAKTLVPFVAGAERGYVQQADGSYAAPDGPPLEALKALLTARIDDKAEETRLKSITPGSGQAMEYQAAQDEAKAALIALAADAKADLNPLDYPMLAASIGSTIDPTTGRPSTDIAGEARGIDGIRKAWVAGASALRELRLSAKKAVNAAGSREAAQAAFDAVAWPDLG